MRVPQGSDPVGERAAVSPERTALVRAADGSAWTYGRLDDDVEGTAGRLAGLGVGAGDHVGLLAETGIPAVRTVFAALRIGAVPVPLNTRLTAAELAPQLGTADVDAVVCEGSTESLAADAVDASTEDAADGDGDPTAMPIASLGGADLDGVAALAEQSPAPVEPAVPDVDDTRLLLFTSGTTDEPKPVELTAGNLRSSAGASAYRLGLARDDRWLVPLAIYHMGGFAPVFRSILYGTTAVLQRSFDAKETLAAIDDHEASCLSVVPTMLRRLLDADGERHRADGADRTGLADLRFVLCGGAATPPALVDRCADRDVELCPTYGATEAASQITTALPAEAREYAGTVGRPLLPTTVRIVDPEWADSDHHSQGAEPSDAADAATVPRGEEGEIVVDGPTISPGYYGDPAATAASRSPLGYHTGDRGYRDEDGRLWVTGRLDDLIATGGELVDPAEVVDAIETHPGVTEAAVVGLDDPEWGERVAALVAADDLAPSGVAQHVEGRLAGYKRPRTVAIVEELPRTASGTVDRDAVRDRLRRDGESV